MATAIGVLRAGVKRERAISLAHADVPDNDFSLLVEMLTVDPGSYGAKA
jgi:hypothetical protein